jgi:hypothetical protein
MYAITSLVIPIDIATFGRFDRFQTGTIQFCHNFIIVVSLITFYNTIFLPGIVPPFRFLSL